MDSEPDDYYEITSQLDAREILRYLNNLGIRNISGEVLKYFITDLKKLIKYDLQHKDDNFSAKTQYSEVLGPERLHSASTFSSRTRSRVQSAEVNCNRDCERLRKRTHVRTVHSAPSLFQQKSDDKPPRRACSCVRVDKQPDIQKEIPKSTVSSNLIKVSKQLIKRKSDPVSLYHYYTSLWAKYKPNVPGENDWSDLRWNIRQKMVGSVASQSNNKATNMQQKHAVKKKKTPTTA
ncbi:uncharacterized protein LOC123869914 [Maniola jurtina]|uniref:uncharacterized protein LOC123869914 n=1 Tax=Maniola jurtina TaxID=191418 RepID=UPI001E68F327|nr:uncharacterized protein LOC123869914 [Maniola jurtina]XP_045768960.1 uncharacterized protein LOC123869914 [Maniola jurtina]XP_045768961.1 uncharacterized protein LOC123869914 [Maniola jurtina]